MKKLAFVTTLILGIGLLGLVGCSKPAGIDISKLESAFQTASAVDKAEVDKAITAVKAGDFSGALASLQKAAASVNLTPEQKSSIEDLITQLKSKVGETVKAAVDDTTKAVKEGADKAATDVRKAVSK